MGIDVDACALGLLQQVLEVVEVMAGDKDTRTLADADVHLCYLRIAVSGGVGLIEECHDINTELTGLEDVVQQSLHVSVGIGDDSKRFHHIVDDVLVTLSETCGMLIVCGHALKAKDVELLERAEVGILVAEDCLTVALSGVVGFCAAPFHLLVVRECYVIVLSLGEELLLDDNAAVDLLEDGCVIEVGIGNGSEKCIGEEVADNCLVEDHSGLVEAIADGCYTADDAQQEVLPTACLRKFTTYTTKGATVPLAVS